ncbi:hypothetical protein ATCC90586_009666 [Pythium insidiosum]|nr:hypothetical protein ATCC90586_009666 [Pythium insidiosum]
MTTAAVVIASHVPAFEAPGCERHTLRRTRRALVAASVPCQPRPPAVSVAVDDGDVYAFLGYLFSSAAAASSSDGDGGGNAAAWRAQVLSYLFRLARLPAVSEPVAVWTQAGERHPHPHPHAHWTVCGADSSHDAGSLAPPSLLVLFTFRPSPLLPLSLGSARRAVKFVHGVVALVTANAYISTLGGGHFLCLHLHQAKLMARLQIAISAGLNDPVLASKCRVNLAYNAMRAGKFRKARRILDEERRVVATELDNNEELEKICLAADVYLRKTIRLHQEFERRRRELSAQDRAVVDNFYRQRVVRKAT